jgi:hypothetical protein
LTQTPQILRHAGSATVYVAALYLGPLLFVGTGRQKGTLMSVFAVPLRALPAGQLQPQTEKSGIRGTSITAQEKIDV